MYTNVVIKIRQQLSNLYKAKIILKKKAEKLVLESNQIKMLAR